MGEKPSKTMVERLGVPTMVALWYLCSIVGNNAGKEVLPLFPYPFTLSLLQFFMGASSVPLYLVARGRPVGHLALLVRHFLNRSLLLGVTGIGSNLLHRVALLYITVSFEHTVKATQPLWSAALSVLLLRQRFSRRTVFALFVITVGVALSAFNEFQFHWLGFFAAMGSAFSMSVANTYQKRFMVKVHIG
jgi:solute carrier family 35 protein E1